MTTQQVISRETGVEEQAYKWGFDFDIESDIAPRGLNEDIVPADLAQEGRTGLDAGVAAEGFSPLADAQ